jgi:hypothetical protein
VLPLVSAVHLAVGGRQLRLHLERSLAPSTYLATIVSELRNDVGKDVDVAGWFEANTHGGPIAFRARTLAVDA